MSGVNHNVRLVLHCTVDGMSQIALVAVQCIMDHTNDVNHSVLLVLHCVVDGITQIAPVAVQCIMDHMSSVNHIRLHL